MRDIAKNLKDARIERGITQEELAQRLFVTRQTVSNYELGRTRPDVDMLARISEILQTDLNTLIYGKEPAPSKKAEKVKAALSTAVLLILIVIAVSMFHTIAHTEVLHLKANLSYWLYMFILPCAYFVCGWMILQVLSLFMKLKKADGKKYTWVRISVIVAILLYVVIVTPYLFGEFFRKQLPGSWNLLAYIVTGTHAKYNTVKIYLPVFFSLGCLIWLFPFSHPNRT